MTGAAESSPNVVWHPGRVSAADRAAALGSATSEAGSAAGAVVWLTGLSGSGKSTVAVELEHQLVSAGRSAYLLDGDNLRHGLNADLGFSAADRAENVRRVGEVACLFADAGLVAIVPVIAPYRADRRAVRARAEALGVMFVEVFVDVDLAICEERDPKGLYRKARAGEITNMTGIDAPYERPEAAEITLRASDGDPKNMAKLIAKKLN